MESGRFRSQGLRKVQIGKSRGLELKSGEVWGSAKVKSPEVWCSSLAKEMGYQEGREGGNLMYIYMYISIHIVCVYICTYADITLD